jgi:hypothetical protein
LPAPLGAMTGLFTGNYVYSFGGSKDGTQVTSTVLFAPINATGSLGAWATTTPLPTATAEHAGAFYNNYVYVLGGAPFFSTSTVFFAPINATGSIGAWATTTPLPAPGLKRLGAAAYNGYLYSFGGTYDGTAGTATSSVFYARINATGSIGSWQLGPRLPTTLMNHSAQIDNGIAYGISGTADGGATSSVLFASVHSDGSLGRWSRTSPMNQFKVNSSIAVQNGYVYAVGGFSDTTVEFAQLASRNTYWGIQVPAGMPTGTYSGTNSFTAVFSP